MSHAIWQVSGGPASRPYADVLLKYGVALIGPGDSGPWSPERYAHDVALQGFVGRFAEEMQVGDALLLRTGSKTVCAVGLVASEYLYLEQFDDVNGWDLQHARRVRWCQLPAEYTFAEPVFGGSPARCSRVSQPEAADFVERFVNSPPTRWQTARLPDLPPEEPPLDDMPVVLRGIVAQARDLALLLQSGGGFGDAPSEGEMVTHFVVPFLRALGWPPELIAVEWRHIDVAVFRSLPRTPGNCQLVIEAKRLGAGVEGALEQAADYMRALGVLCDVAVSDGVRYRLYDGRRDFAHVAYANLARLKRPAAALFDRIKRG